MATKDPLLLDDALELAGLLTPAWANISGRIPDWHPRCEGEEGAADGDADGSDSGGEGAAEADGSGEADGGNEKTVDDYRRELRESDRVRKREAAKKEKELEQLRAQLKERQDADKSEQEKALDKAREEARGEARSEAEKERRADRLEVAVARLAARGVKVGDEEALQRFEDPEDAQTFLERAIRNGVVDEDDIFDADGKVNNDAIAAALSDILKAKPRLAAGTTNGNGAGASDAGQGSGGKGMEDMSVEEHLKRIQKERSGT